VRALFQPPRVRPASQRLAPVTPLHQIGDQTFVAASDSLRSWLTLPALATPMPTPRGGLPGGERPGPNASPSQPQIVATLFVGLEADGVLGDVEHLRRTLLALLAGTAILAVVTAQGIVRTVT